MRKLLRDSSW